jgi:V/A-type H+-transporting ATPase subunit I
MIARMSKYEIVLHADRCRDLLERLRQIGLVDITCNNWEPTDEERQLLSAIEEHSKAIDVLKRFVTSDAYRATKQVLYATGEEAFDAYRTVAQKRAALQAEIEQLQKGIEEARPWGDFAVSDLQRLAEQGVTLRFFVAQRAVYDASAEAWSEQAVIEPIAEDKSSVWFVTVQREATELTLDAQEVKMPTLSAQEAEERVAELRTQLAATDVELSRVAESMELLAQHRNRLREALQGAKVTTTATAVVEGRLLLLEGWAEKESSAQVDALLDECPEVVYLKSDPTPEDNTPVKLKNNRFARIFELVGDLYARPRYGTLDLTPFFAPFYMLFFGICLNDAGYGLVLLAMGLWMLCKYREGMMHQAAWFATMCATSTVVVGLVCGSFFGLSLKSYFPAIPFFDFQGQFFAWALAIGVLQILFGLLLCVVTVTCTIGIRYALATLGWLLVILAGSLALGLPMLNEAWTIPGFSGSSPAFYAMVGVGLLLMLFFNSPGKNPFVNVGSGLWNLYNNITGILSDVLSYIRLFAIGLSGGVLAQVFNSLATGLSPDIPVVHELVVFLILLVGHGINLFMSTISSFVHPMRLTFVEFYKNAGFEMTNRSFEPIRKIEE